MAKIVKKSDWWWLTIWASPNVTTAIGETIYLAQNESEHNLMLISHEEIHLDQQKRVGLVKYILLYLFCFPFFWNPWRWRWEWEAYEKGSCLGKWQIEKILRSGNYGWLKNPVK
jgi:hypothetical protein